MLKCKLCGASNDANSSVCAICGTPLKKRSRKRPTEYKDIYSNTDPNKNNEINSDSMDVFSSGEMFEKAKKDQVLDKIYKQELALGEVPHLPTENESAAEPEAEPFQPVVINRETTSDIVGNYKKSNKKNKHRNQGDKIPQRVIESSRPQAESAKASLGKKSGTGGSGTKSHAGNQKQKSHQDKHNEKKEELFVENPRKKSKPSDEELVPLTSSAKSIKRNQNHKRTIDTAVDNAIVTVVSSSEKSAAAHSPDSSAVKYIKNTNADSSKKKPKRNVPEQPLKKPSAEQPLRKATAANSKTNAVKTEKAVITEKKQKPKSKTDSPNEKKVNVSKKNSVPKAKNTTAEIPVPLQKETHTEPDIDAVIKPNQNSDKPSLETNIKKTDTSAFQRDKIAVAVDLSQKKTSPVNKTPNDSTKKKPAEKKPAEKKPVKTFFSDEDIAENTTTAALSYFGILLLIPYFKRKKSKLCRVHSKQGIVVFFYSLIIELLTLLIILGLRILTVWILMLPYIVFDILFIIILAVMASLIIIPVYVGAKAAFNGIYKTVPIVGKFVKKSKKKPAVHSPAKRKTVHNKKNDNK